MPLSSIHHISRVDPVAVVLSVRPDGHGPDFPVYQILADGMIPASGAALAIYNRIELVKEMIQALVVDHAVESLIQLSGPVK